MPKTVVPASTSSAPAAPAATAASAVTAGQYRIAAVSMLTGMPVPTIRMWERRYNVVTPARSAANGRLYSRDDIDRLILLKTAVDAGHAIGTIATLSDAELQQRLGSTPNVRPLRAAVQACQVLVCGRGLADRLQMAWDHRQDVTLSATLPAMPGEGYADAGHADVVIVDAPSLQATAIRHLRQLRVLTRARLMIVVYGFATKQTLARLDQENMIAVPTPADPAQLARICLLGMAIDLQPDNERERRLLQPAAPRRYDDAFLVSMSRLSSTIRCECPNHLADLLGKLNAFEQYSLECESATSADASLHALLYSATAQCREMLERALSHVLEHEGIPEPIRPL